MAGIYIHIPFCKQKCTYCDFYSIVNASKTDEFLKALLKEISGRRNYLKNDVIETIYFGGGTPSLLNANQFENIFNSLYENFIISNDAEITIEANPDDLNEHYLQLLSTLPFNRLSIGIQSFNDNELTTIKRRHNASDAIQAFYSARKSGFSNISVDIIYGLPEQTLESWKNNIDQVLKLQAEHISVYGLTYEPGTLLYKQKSKGQIHLFEEDVLLEMHQYMVNRLTEAGYLNYEISNFALSDKISKHNSAYWKFVPYIGFGPSAHSFNGISRQWNIASINQYINLINSESVFYDFENLTDTDLQNEYLMVSLRTSEGISKNDFISKFGQTEFNNLFNKSQQFIQQDLIKNNELSLCLSKKGLLISDFIIVKLMKTTID